MQRPDDPAAAMEFRVLGPLDVQIGGNPVEIRGRHQPKVLAMLLLGDGELVPVSRLIEALWEDPPETARRQLQNTVAALRRTLSAAGHDPIEYVGEGYRLRSENVDVRRFTDLARRGNVHLKAGRLVEAHGDLCAAVDLWRGQALAGMSGTLIERVAARLDEQRLVVLEDRMEAELSMGHHGRVVNEARMLMEASPYRQRTAGLLFEALHRSGRTPEALQEYEIFRTRLADGLGVDPNGALRRLHLAMLRDEELAGEPSAPVASAADTASHSELPADVPRFVGRRDHLATLDGVVTELRGVAATPVVLTGTGGVGKTALAVHWAHTEPVRQAFPDGRLFVDLRGFGGDPVSAADALRQLLRQLGATEKRLPHEIGAAQAMLRDRLGRGRFLIVLDDAADAAQVRPLLWPVAGCLTVVTSRDRMDGLAARQGARRVFLNQLASAESEALIRQLLGAETVAAEQQAAQRLSTLCARLPLALHVAAAGFESAHPDTSLTQYVAELEADRLLTLDAGGDDTTAVASVLSWSTSRLSDEAARQFCLLGIHPGPRMDPEAAAALLDTPVPHARRALRALAAVSLCEETGPGRFAMHDLLREHAQQMAGQLGVEPASAHVRLLRHYIEHLDSAAPGRIRGELPTLLACLGLSDGPELAEYAQRLGNRLADLACFRESYTAHTTARKAAEPDSMVWLLATQGLARVGPVFGDDQDYASQALRGFRALGESRQVVATLRIQAEHAVETGDLAANLALNQDALELARQLRDPEAEAEALTAIAYSQYGTGAYSKVIEYATRGARLAGETGDQSTEAHALQYLGKALRDSGRLPEAVTHLETALRLHTELGNEKGMAQVHSELGAAHRIAGDPYAAVRHSQTSVDMQRDFEDQYGLAVALDNLGRAAHAAGNAQLAHDSYAETRSISDSLGNPIGIAFADIGLGELARATTDHATATSRFREALRIFENNPYSVGEAMAHEGLGRTLLEAGDHTTALPHLRVALALHCEHGSPKADPLQAIIDAAAQEDEPPEER